MADFGNAFSIILDFEGGYSDHPLDKGGKTKYGITEKVAREYGYANGIKDMPLRLAKEIYKVQYWESINLHKLKNNDVAVEVFDIAVNMGIGTAGRILQRSLNLVNKKRDKLKVDGIVGTKTIAVTNEVKGLKVISLVKCINGEQYIKYKKIVKNNPAMKVFFNGWVKRT